MSRKDYRAIADAILYTKGHFLADETVSPGAVLRVVTQYLAEALAKDNPTFDRARFLRYVETGKDSAWPQGDRRDRT